MRRKQHLDPRLYVRWKGYVICYADAKRIVELVRRFPGANQSFIKSQIGLPWDVVRYHLKQLQQQSRLQVARPHRKVKRYFVRGDEVKAGALAGIYWKPHYQVLVDLIDKLENPRRVDILDHAALLSWPRSTTGYRLARLLESGLVRSEGVVNAVEGRSTRYMITDLARRPLREMELLIWTIDDDVLKARIKKSKAMKDAFRKRRREEQRRIRAKLPKTRY